MEEEHSLLVETLILINSEAKVNSKASHPKRRGLCHPAVLYGGQQFGQFISASCDHTRINSLAPQAWASQPRCLWGKSPSMISGTWPTHP